jgi:hypothetical protein
VLNRLLPILLIAFIGLPMARADDSKVQLMFVQTADDLRADGKTLRLVNVTQQTLYFSDRPVRMAGQIALTGELQGQRATEEFVCD